MEYGTGIEGKDMVESARGLAKGPGCGEAIYLLEYLDHKLWRQVCK